MSNEVLPRLPGQTLKQGRASTWNNTVRKSKSGRTFARSHWVTLVREYRMEYEFLRAGVEAELQQLEGFFNRHKGDADTWLLDDENDRSVVGQPIGVGDGVRSAFQLVRTRGGFVEPVYELNGQPLLYLDGHPAGTNLLQNPSFELGSTVATGWVGYVSGSVLTPVPSLPADSPAFGSKVQRVVAAGTTTASARIGVYQRVEGLTPGVTYTLSGLVGYRVSRVTSATNLRITAFISFRNGADAQVGSATFDINTPGASFVPISVTSAAPAGTVAAYVYFWIMSIAVTADAFSIDIDGAQFIPGAARTDFEASRFNWSIVANGLLTFAPHAPVNGAVITASFDYFWRCRFTRSAIDFEQFLHDLWSLRQLEFVTDKP